MANNNFECAVIRNSTMALGVIPYFTVASDDQPIGKIYDERFSRIKMSLSEKGNTSVTANIPLKEWPGIIKKLDFCEIKAAIQLAENHGSTSVNSGAYTVILAAGNGCKGKTPAEVLSDSEIDGIAVLTSQRDFLKSHLTQYPKNQTQIDAINEALLLYKEGNLSTEVLPQKVSCSETTVYSGLMHGNMYKMHSNKSGFYKTTDCLIVYHQSDNYPIEVTIREYYAPVTRLDDGRQLVSAKEAIDKKQISMRVSYSDFIYIANQIADRKSCFLNANAVKIQERISLESQAYSEEKVPAETIPAVTEPTKIPDNEYFTGKVDGFYEDGDLVFDLEDIKEDLFEGYLTSQAMPAVEDDESFSLPVITEDGEPCYLVFSKELSLPWLRKYLTQAAKSSKKIPVQGKINGDVITFENLWNA